MANKNTKRSASEVYERIVPITLGVLIFLIVSLGLITFAVLFGLWPH